MNVSMDHLIELKFDRKQMMNHGDLALVNKPQEAGSVIDWMKITSGYTTSFTHYWLLLYNVNT